MPIVLTMDEERDIWTQSRQGAAAPPVDACRILKDAALTRKIIQWLGSRSRSRDA
ncbi:MULTISPECIES: hypothetical protein [Bradyrhizobium]|uniref:hypothetical protein n=1 Tax=Bradyrhizobium TaxID=374 RepID=UPI00041D4545|nr:MULTISPECIES: hypothetical protein [Bradyrhizobium]MBR0881563.1 hypothetical protein [Bradyrhizobium liaoningense]MBR1001530.1 hypothetical protein [Bradyrhizobium liaoningense]MBR1067861.1 hypothetical protein [Bradyrhizobium liaoningense]